MLQEEQCEELFATYLNVLHKSNVNVKSLLSNLKSKQIILSTYNIPKEGDPFDPHLIPFNKVFIKQLYKSSFELGKELFEEYPRHTSINGSIIPLRGVSKHFNSLEDSYFRYGKSIGWDIKKHNEIIDLIKWSKEQDIIKKSLGSFIVDNAWLDLQALRDGDVANVNYDAIKMI